MYLHSPQSPCVYAVDAEPVEDGDASDYRAHDATAHSNSVIHAEDARMSLRTSGSGDEQAKMPGPMPNASSVGLEPMLSPARNATTSLDPPVRMLQLLPSMLVASNNDCFVACLLL